MIKDFTTYKTTGGTEVRIKEAINRKNMETYFGDEILQLLGKTITEKEEKQAALKDQDIVIGCMDDIYNAVGYRHRQSGTCVRVTSNITSEQKLSELRKQLFIKNK